MSTGLRGVYPPESRFDKVLSFAGSVALSFAGLAVFAFLLFVHAVVVRTVPDNAMVLVDWDSRTYFSPPMVRSDSREFLMPAPFAFVQGKGIPAASAEVEVMINASPPGPDDMVYVDLKRGVFALYPRKGAQIVVPVKMGDIRGNRAIVPDSNHRDKNGFIDKPVGWLGYFVEKVGLRKPRWTKSGDWNW